MGGLTSEQQHSLCVLKFILGHMVPAVGGVGGIIHTERSESLRSWYQPPR